MLLVLGIHNCCIVIQNVSLINNLNIIYIKVFYKKNVLIFYTFTVDWRVRPLVLVIKLWAQHHDINNAKDMTISSYSLVLMVIHFLQCMYIAAFIFSGPMFLEELEYKYYTILQVVSTLQFCHAYIRYLKTSLAHI